MMIRAYSIVCALVVVAALFCWGCGGGDGGGWVPGSGVLFVAANRDLSLEAVAIFDRATAADGIVQPTRYLSGGNTNLFNIRTLALDAVEATNDLYVADAANNAILVFHPATGVTGNTAPARTIMGPQVPLLGPGGLDVDTTRDILYVTDNAVTGIYVWDDASQINGDVPPDRFIDLDRVCRDVAIDPTHDRLFASSGDEVVIVENASTRTGEVQPDRVIRGTATRLDSCFGLAVDVARDRLYVASRDSDAVLVYDELDTIEGNVAPRAILAGAATGVNNPVDVSLDRRRDHLYVVNDEAVDEPVRVWERASSAGGNLPPTRIIAAPDGLLSESRAVAFM